MLANKCTAQTTGRLVLQHFVEHSVDCQNHKGILVFYNLCVIVILLLLYLKHYVALTTAIVEIVDTSALLSYV